MATREVEPAKSPKNVEEEEPEREPAAEVPGEKNVVDEEGERVMVRWRR